MPGIWNRTVLRGLKLIVQYRFNIYSTPDDMGVNCLGINARLQVAIYYY